MKALQLLDKGCDIDGLTGRRSETALHVAVKSTHQEGKKDQVVRTLLARQCKSMIKNNVGLAPIHYAGRLQDNAAAMKLVKSLVQYDKCNVNLKASPEGGTALHQAIVAGNSELTEFLLCSGADRKIRGRVTERLKQPQSRKESVYRNDRKAYPLGAGECDNACLFFCCFLCECMHLTEQQCDTIELCLQDTLCPCCKPIPLEYASNQDMRFLISSPRQTDSDQQISCLCCYHEPVTPVAQTITRGESADLPPSYDACVSNK